MNIDTGLAVVIIAVLIFYLRLIGLQRERVKRIAVASQGSEKKKNKTVNHAERYTILSPRRRDRVIAGSGGVAVLIGVLLYLNISPVLQPYWWIPTAIGIVAFSWAFKV